MTISAVWSRRQFAPRVVGRDVCCILVAIVLMFATFSGAIAQGVPKGQGAAKGGADAAPLKHVDKLLSTADGWQIAVTYYPSRLGQEAPAIILLHGRQDDRLVWDQGFATKLQGEGYAVISVDLRKSGQSRSSIGEGEESKLRPVDFQQMVVEDLRVVKDFLMERHQNKELNIRKTGIIAPEMSAPVALAFAVADWIKPPYDDAPVDAERTPRGQDVRAIVFMSPELSVPGLPTSKYISQIRNPNWNLAFMTIYATEDEFDRGDANKLYQKLTIPTEKVDRSYLQTYSVALRGAKILDGDPDVEAKIQAFFKLHLKELPDPWRDRKSPLSK